MDNSKIFCLKATINVTKGRRARAVWQIPTPAGGISVQRIHYIAVWESVCADPLNNKKGYVPFLQDATAQLDIYNTNDKTPGTIIEPSEITFPSGGEGNADILPWLGWSLEPGHHEFNNLILNDQSTICAQGGVRENWLSPDTISLIFYVTVLIEYE